MTRQKTILCCAFAFLFPTAGWASLGACSGAYTVASSGLLAGGNGGTPVAGCEQVDLNFNNFSYSIVSVGPAADYLPIAFSGASTPGTITDTLGSSGSGDWPWIGGLTETVQTNTVAVDSSLSNGTTITQATLAVGASLGATPSSASYVLMAEEFCLGSATFNCTSSSSNFGIIEYVLNGSGSVTYSASCYGGGAICQQLATDESTAGTATVTLTDLNAGTAGLTLNIPSTTSLTVENIVKLSDSDDAGLPFASLSTYANEWTEATPEPSTFWLLGAALTILVARRGSIMSRR